MVQTVVPKNRWAAHKCEANSDKVKYPIHFAIRKYGADNFQFCLISAHSSQDEVNKAEIYWIDFFDSKNNECGYNLAVGGNSNSGWHHLEETKKKISESNMGKILPPHTQEWKDNMSKIMTNRIMTDEWKNKIGEGRRGKLHIEEAKKIMSNLKIGKKLSQETKNKISTSNKNISKNVGEFVLTLSSLGL